MAMRGALLVSVALQVAPALKNPPVEPRALAQNADAPEAAIIHQHKLLYNQNEWIRSQFKKETLIQGKGLAKNLCEDGHYVPEVFILGAHQAGTTTFASDLDRSPAIQFATGFGPLALGQNMTHKEGHFFDFYHHQGAYMMPKSYPACQQRTKVVAVDATARYLMDPKVPERLHTRYLRMPLEPGRVKFVVLLRDPLYRLQSDFYHSVDAGLCKLQQQQSFKTFLLNLLEGSEKFFVGGEDHCSDRVEGSLYRDQLVRWFKWFPQPQFTIVPWLYAVSPGVGGRKNVALIPELWKQFGVQSATLRPGTHLGKRLHPTFEQEGLKAHTIAKARDWFDKRTGAHRLAEIFAIGGPQTKRAHLFGYRGDSEDQQAIASWIETNWGQAPQGNLEKEVKLAVRRHRSGALEDTMPADDRKGIEDYNVLLARPEQTYSPEEWMARRLYKAEPKLLSSNAHNLCQQGWVMPSHYVLGGPSGGTTSFASDLDASPSIQFGRGWGQGRLPQGMSYKETHAMDTYFRAGHWFNKMCYVPCEENKKIIATDATARYLLDPTVPGRLKERYARGPQTYMKFKDEANAIKELKFSVLLRDPLSRFHSDFYRARAAGLCDHTRGMNFSNIVDEILGGKADFYMGGHGGCSDRLEGSLYVDQLKRWLKTFHPSQFTIIPWLYQVSPGVDGRDGRTLAEATWERLGAEPVKSPVRDTHLMKGEHRTLEEEHLSADQLQDLRFFFNKMAGPDVLAKVLASSGANLYGYLGADNDESAIASWLATNWKDAAPSA